MRQPAAPMARSYRVTRAAQLAMTCNSTETQGKMEERIAPPGLLLLITNGGRSAAVGVLRHIACIAHIVAPWHLGHEPRQRYNP